MGCYLETLFFNPKKLDKCKLEKKMIFLINNVRVRVENKREADDTFPHSNSESQLAAL